MPTRRTTHAYAEYIQHRRTNQRPAIGSENLHLEESTEFRCVECDEVYDFKDTDRKVHDDDEYCADCFDDKFDECHDCNHYCDKEGGQETHDGEWICEDCYENNWFTCESCEEIHDEDNRRNTDNGAYCYECFDEQFCYCRSCETLLDRDDAHYVERPGYSGERTYCDECYEQAENRGEILNWSHKPEPNFKNIQRQIKTKLFYGIELEIDAGSGSGADAKKIKAESPDVYIKADASLDTGFEIVSHPASYRYHTERLNWKGIIKKAEELGYKSHDTSTCGIHIHVSKKFFGKNAKERDSSIMKLLYLTQSRIWPQLKKFSRRNSKNSMENYASSFHDLYDPLQLLYEAKHSERHRNINIHPDQTIEFRFFRGTLNYNTFIANIQFIRIVSEMATALDISDIKKVEWSDIVVYAEAYKFKEFIKFVKQRKLYELPRRY